MSNNKKKLIEIYKKAINKGILPCDGLCATISKTNSLNANLNLDLFEPLREDKIEMKRSCLSVAYWASGVSWESNDKYYTFTPLRQTILAFLIAMEK